jgi:hypothetical protein
VDGKLHGTWTVFFTNGQKEWERQHRKDRKEGYFRRWDKAGRLIEEPWYHLDELHGQWRRWDEAGREEVVGNFYFGYPRQGFDRTSNLLAIRSKRPASCCWFIYPSSARRTSRR